jgi:DNA-binding transcriptional ArsR family regulator
MDVTGKMAAVAAAMASPSRLKMLEALAGGVARSAIDLAAVADIQPNTATTHLQALCRADLVKVLKQGRYRYFQIRSESVGDLVEALGEHTGDQKSSVAAPMSDMAFGRTCYDHLAGWLGVRLTESLVANGLVTRVGNSFELTDQGAVFLGDLGVEVDDARKARRVFARACQDWTEGEAHIGGALGAKLYDYFHDHRWIRKNEEYREVYVLPKGRKNFSSVFGLELG